MTSTEDHCYKAVSKLSTPLSNEERVEVMTKLRHALHLYEGMILNSPDAREVIYRMYNEKVKMGHAISRLSRGFNMSKKGTNKLLARIVEDTMKSAFVAETEYPNTAPFLLRGLELSYDLLLHPEVTAAANSTCSAGEVADRIEKLQDRLFRSVVKLASDIAVKKSRRTSGDVIAYEDMLHEAVLAARSGVKAYRPNDGYSTAEDSAAAFTTFIHVWVNGSLSKFESENSRTVKLPRTVIDRWVPVGEALGTLEGGSYEDVAKLATKILHDKRQRSRNKKLGRSEVYTAEEVFELIIAVQETASLDLEFHADDTGAVRLSLSDLIRSEDPNPDDAVDTARLNRSITMLFQEYCTPDQFLLMSLRWGMGEVRGMKETADLFENHTGRRVTKSKIASIERLLFQKLKHDPRAKELFEVING